MIYYFVQPLAVPRSCNSEMSVPAPGGIGKIELDRPGRVIVLRRNGIATT
jgi:hypothetical protein